MTKIKENKDFRELYNAIASSIQDGKSEELKKIMEGRVNDKVFLEGLLKHVVNSPYFFSSSYPTPNIKIEQIDEDRSNKLSWLIGYFSNHVDMSLAMLRSAIMLQDCKINQSVIDALPKVTLEPKVMDMTLNYLFGLNRFEEMTALSNHFSMNNRKLSMRAFYITTKSEHSRGMTLVYLKGVSADLMDIAVMDSSNEQVEYAKSLGLKVTNPKKYEKLVGCILSDYNDYFNRPRQDNDIVARMANNRAFFDKLRLTKSLSDDRVSPPKRFRF